MWEVIIKKKVRGAFNVVNLSILKGFLRCGKRGVNKQGRGSDEEGDGAGERRGAVAGC